MLEIADGIILAAIILAFLPYLLVIVLYLVPPTIGIAVGAGLGYVVAAGEGQSLITDLFEKSRFGISRSRRQWSRSGRMGVSMSR